MTFLSIMFVTFFVLASFTVMPIIHGEDNEDDEKNNISGLKEQEREHEQGEDDGGLQLGSGANSVILYGTIVAIAVAIGYSGFKIITIRRKSSKSS